ncbi:MAG: penicillin-binding protein [Minisyncoccus archaeiphilus]|uniref:peptidoglycan D,D-transpeptidase FtsI family protein n=1 Tax=Minisyncoccus archaeiphilus TaxID=3238481 RepID=UPI002B19ABAB|nr:MAG: penicillin-binding protein [Candidatus Parcubacteria bacterium]
MKVKQSNIRSNFILIMIFLIGGVLLYRLFYLQISNGERYKEIAVRQQSAVMKTQGQRGSIYFKGGEPLALIEKDPLVFVSPEEVLPEEKEDGIKKLTEILNMEESQIREKFNKDGFYQVIARNLDSETVEKVRALKMKGVYIDQKKEKRYYPAENTASQIVGFLNEDMKGQYGLEEHYDDKLSGKVSSVERDKNPWGFIFSFNDDTSLNGESLTLTIDYNIQFMAEKYLKEGIEKYGAEGGDIIVMDPNTGEIIAMAQYPNFNPNNFKGEKFENLSNNAIQRVFEPGSIFKPITMAMGVNEGLVTPDTPFHDNVGCVAYGRYNVCNYTGKAWGDTDMTGILKRSINTGVMYVEEKVGNEKFLEYLKNFGFFEKTGVDLANETYSNNSTIKQAYDHKIQVTFANASFGQGLSTTPLRMTVAFACLANGGKLMKPYIVKEFVSGGGKNTVKKEPEVVRQVISQSTSDDLKKMLIQVVESGYGHLAKVPGYYIAGKTGTSQVPYASLGINQAGYSDHTWQTFMGFAPANDPKFIALVKLNNATKVRTSEYSAVPIFHNLAKYILDYWQIPPDYEVEEEEKKEEPKAEQVIIDKKENI